MRLNKRRRPPGFAMDMTPMIDVTFQLIIFFMTVSQASQAEFQALELPKLAGSVDQQPTTLTVNVMRDETLILRDKPVTLDGLAAVLREEIDRKQGRPELVSVVLRIDRNLATSSRVNGIFAALRKAGIPRSRIAVQVPQ